MSKYVEKAVYDIKDIDIIKRFLATIQINFMRSHEAAAVIDAIERGKIIKVKVEDKK